MRWEMIDFEKLEITNKNDKCYKNSKKKKTKKSNHKHIYKLGIQICNYGFSDSFYFVDFIKICEICGKITLAEYSHIGTIKKIYNKKEFEKYLLEETKKLLLKKKESDFYKKVDCLCYKQNNFETKKYLEIYYSENDLLNIKNINDTVKYIGHIDLI